jgi:hypothetical protein
MVWLLIAASIYTIIFVAGRAHSRYLDRLEARPRVVMTVQLFNVSPDLVKETEFTVDLTSEAIHNIPIEALPELRWDWHRAQAGQGLSQEIDAANNLKNKRARWA